ncbi:uncharacterized protein O3C94_019154 [Discoglossus pictus]
MAALTFPAVTPSAAAVFDLSIPLPAAIFLAVSLYIIVLLFLLLLHQCLQARGCCPSCLGFQKVGDLGLCDLCIRCAQLCDCGFPSMTQCLDRCCPSKPSCNCLSCCPLCDFACTYQPPDCNTINCICFEIKLR